MKNFISALAGMALGLLVEAAAWAQSVFVISLSSSQAQIMVNGTAARSLWIGETSPEGVRLSDIRNGLASFEAGGRRFTLGLGQSSVTETVLRASSSGHFFVNAVLNGVTFPAVIDTGATLVVLNLDQAESMGIDMRQSRRVTTHTANGPAPAYVITLASVQVGEIGLLNVPAMVIEGGGEKLPTVLIGMSFLKHVEMRRAGQTMTLTRSNPQ
jgi:aspartyl protease family protein